MWWCSQGVFGLLSVDRCFSSWLRSPCIESAKRPSGESAEDMNAIRKPFGRVDQRQSMNRYQRIAHNRRRTGSDPVVFARFNVPGFTVGVLCTALLLAGCGYAFVGGGTFPAGVERIFVTLFENRTSEVGVENLLAQQLANQFTTRGRSNALAGAADSADAVMKGRIRTVNIFTIARRSETVSSERRVVIRVSAQLESPEGRILWRADDVSATATFRVADAGSSTDLGARRALDEAAKLVAENLFNRLTANF